MKTFAVCLLTILTLSVASAAVPTVAVWDPAADTDVPGHRFQLRQTELDAAATWLTDAGMSVQRVRADALNGAFDVLVLPGSCFPKQALADLKRFTEDGGVLVTLEGLAPLLVRIELGSSGKWQLSPASPSFAWQSDELIRHFGFRYDWKPELHDQGKVHTPTPLLKQYLPEEAVIRKTLPGRWLPSTTGGVMLPLIQSERFDGVPVLPQIFVARRGKATGVFCTNIEWATRERVVALVRLASDLHEGKVSFDNAVTLPETIPLPEPLRLREPCAGIEPENAKTLQRWGKFDGSSNELGDPLPRSLPAGATVTLPLPVWSGDPCFVRIRGAFNESGAVLKIASGTTVLWNEVLTFIDAMGESNWGILKGGEPIEFNRIVFLPKQAPTLTISNAGTAPLFFDAVQIEQRAVGPDVYVGLGIADWPGFPVTEAESQAWPCVRAPMRLQLVGEPDKEDRWAKTDALIRDRFGKVNSRIHGVIQNTPPWAALDADHLREARANHRERDVAPDPAKYIPMVEEFIARYGDIVEGFELWNEPNLKQFYWGTAEEFLDLFYLLAPAVRKAKPDALIIGPGFAGHSMDKYLKPMSESAAMDCVDWLAVHCYCGKGPAWDRTAYGYEGDLYALGVNKPIYANEQGFVFRNAQWFTAPPVYTEHLQGINTSIGMARLMAGGICKVNVFMIGPGNHEFDLIRADGTPRPAYPVVKDYMALSRRGSTRLDVSMTAAADTPLLGMYVAAAAHTDGSITLIVNPAEIERLQPPREILDPSSDFAKGTGNWSGFQGKAIRTNGVLRLVPSKGQTYMGYAEAVTLDLDRWPVVEVDLPECAPTWSFTLRANGQDTTIFQDLPAGRHRADLREFLTTDEPLIDAQTTFRVSGPTAIAAVRYLPAEAANDVTVKPDNNLLKTSQTSTFFGNAIREPNGVNLTPEAGKAYVGYTFAFTVDPAKNPYLEVEAADCQRPWSMSLKIDDKQATVFTDQKAGTARTDLRSLIAGGKLHTVSATLRATGPMQLTAVRLIADPNSPPKSRLIPSSEFADRKPVPVCIQIPLSQNHSVYDVQATVSGVSVPATLRVPQTQGVPYAVVQLGVTGRTQITLTPKK